MAEPPDNPPRPPSGQPAVARRRRSPWQYIFGVIVLCLRGRPRLGDLDRRGLRRTGSDADPGARRARLPQPHTDRAANSSADPDRRAADRHPDTAIADRRHPRRRRPTPISTSACRSPPATRA